MAEEEELWDCHHSWGHTFQVDTTEVEKKKTRQDDWEVIKLREKSSALTNDSIDDDQNDVDDDNDEKDAGDSDSRVNRKVDTN